MDGRIKDLRIDVWYMGSGAPLPSPGNQGLAVYIDNGAMMASSRACSVALSVFPMTDYATTGDDRYSSLESYARPQMEKQIDEVATETLLLPLTSACSPPEEKAC